MLHATLICTDDGCAMEFEAWGEPDELDALLCEDCDCALQALAFSDFAPAAPVRLQAAAAHTPLRRAA
jgi:hypothetical protein